MALVSALKYGEAGKVEDTHRKAYADAFLSMCDTLVEIQGDDGAWSSSLTDREHFPHPDVRAPHSLTAHPPRPCLTRPCGRVQTSATAAFTYALAYGINSRLIDAKDRDYYKTFVWKAWDYLSGEAIEADDQLAKPANKLGWCQPPGDTPSAASGYSAESSDDPWSGSTPYNSNSTSDFCVGMFMMAAAEVAQMAAPPHAPPPPSPAEPVKKHRPLLAILIVVVVAAIAVGGGCCWWRKRRANTSALQAHLDKNINEDGLDAPLNQGATAASW